MYAPADHRAHCEGVQQLPGLRPRPQFERAASTLPDRQPSTARSHNEPPVCDVGLVAPHFQSFQQTAHPLYIVRFYPHHVRRQAGGEPQTARTTSAQRPQEAQPSNAPQADEAAQEQGHQTPDSAPQDGQ